MACVKCGSSWTTQHGADRASCPECCKQARCRERAAGRYVDSVQKKVCVGCGAAFVASGAAQIVKRTCCSDTCHRRNKGTPDIARPKPATTEARGTTCLYCGSGLASRNQRKFCSRRCFHDARKAGVQAWDRTAIVLSALVRPSNKARSSLCRFARRCMADMHAYMRRASGVLNEAGARHKSLMRAKPPGSLAMKAFLQAIPAEGVCPRCGERFVSRAGARVPHCTAACFKADRTTHECIRCGEVMEVHFSGGNVEERRRRPMCGRCVIHTSPSQKGKRGHKGRCLKFGVPYDPTVRPYKVFERDGFVCHLCNRRTLTRVSFVGRSPHPRSPVVDHHPYPLSAGVMGHEWGNVRCACWSCNSMKGARMGVESGAFAAEPTPPWVGGVA